jgi:hypothetical protein
MKVVPVQRLKISPADYRKSTHTRSDAVAVKCLLLWKILPSPFGFLSDFSRFSRCSKPPTSLLIHFCSWSDAIYGHKEQFLWFDLAKEEIDIGKYGGENVLLRKPKMGVVVIRV